MGFGASRRLVKASRPALKIFETFAPIKDFVKCLGVIFDFNLNWQENIDTVASKVSRRLRLFGRIRIFISIDICKQLHNSTVQPLYEYCDTVLSNSDKTYLEILLRLLKRGARIILKRKIREVSSQQLLKELRLVTTYLEMDFSQMSSRFMLLKWFLSILLTDYVFS